MTYQTALIALADPTRRQVFERVLHGPRSVGEITKHLTVSRPAVSQHLKVLKDAGLVQEQRVGTRRLYQADPKALGELRAYVDDMWRTALDRFADSMTDEHGSKS